MVDDISQEDITIIEADPFGDITSFAADKTGEVSVGDEIKMFLKVKNTGSAGNIRAIFGIGFIDGGNVYWFAGLKDETRSFAAGEEHLYPTLFQTVTSEMLSAQKDGTDVILVAVTVH